MARRKHYHVYVVELSGDVLLNIRFMRSNPSYKPGEPCVYVGMTGLDPDVRFDKHKAGIQANRYVQEFGQRLLPELYELYNPLTYDDARSLEVELGIDLRAGGLGFGRLDGCSPLDAAITGVAVTHSPVLFGRSAAVVGIGIGDR